MSLRIFMAGAMLATLGACESGGNDQAANDRGSGNTVRAAGASPGASPLPAASPSASASVSKKVAADCTQLPDFVPLYGDARVETCVSGPGEVGHESGTVIYTTGALPGAIIDWYKGKAKAEGLTEGLATPTLFNAREDGKRSITTMVETVRGATKVTVNWGRDI